MFAGSDSPFLVIKMGYEYALSGPVRGPVWRGDINSGCTVVTLSAETTATRVHLASCANEILEIHKEGTRNKIGKIRNMSESYLTVQITLH